MGWRVEFEAFTELLEQVAHDSDPGGEDRGDLMDQCSRHAIPPAIRSSSPTGGGTV
jgi:hypothetical protein